MSQQQSDRGFLQWWRSLFADEQADDSQEQIRELTELQELQQRVIENLRIELAELRLANSEAQLMRSSGVSEEEIERRQNAKRILDIRDKYRTGGERRQRGVR